MIGLRARVSRLGNPVLRITASTLFRDDVYPEQALFFPVLPPLTASQARALDAFRRLERELAPVLPSNREVASVLGCDPSWPGQILQDLTRLGHLVRDPSSGRTCRTLRSAPLDAGDPIA